ncbi:uncharacterized protein LOC142333898 [Lycorma delicatula]|uniref:uncharacterized protein LOC142333898 n=1 Tax=Lycorma delicatula TaxID=130591 RepID=UPI003F50ED5A
MKKKKEISDLVVKPANIRIWIHDRDLGRLQQVLWEGQGDRLRLETSHHPLIRRFLSAVPYIMGTIKELHQAAVNNDLIMLKKHSQDPIPRDILRSKDSNGLTPLHKAAGLGNAEIVKEILLRCPEALNVQDREGRTALHYAAALRDDGQMYRILKEAGALEDILDKKGRPAGFYQVKPKELLDTDDCKLLTQIPDAPRTASIHPPSWDWRILQSDCDSGSSSYYSSVVNNNNNNNNNHQNQPSVNGDSAFEDMGIEEPPTETTQRFIDNERLRNTIMNEEEIDEGVGAEADEPVRRTDGNENRQNILEREADNLTESDREYEEVGPQPQIHNNEVINNNRLQQTIQPVNDVSERLGNSDGSLDYPNEDNTNSNYEDHKRNDKNNENHNNINDDTNNNNNNQRKAGNWRNITSRNQSPPHFSQAPAPPYYSYGQNNVSRPFDSPYRPRTVTVNERRTDNHFGNQEIETDSEVREIVDSGDLEGMADLVLSGHGDKLLSCRSRLPDVQMFIDNVPTYMAKIKAVHAYTREGNLRGVQTALDRRKFAVSRERGGLTPLHEATLYGRAAVLRYLAARFPETLHARDHHGRTALHYAATLPDNAHFYNVLLTLGADKDMPDVYSKTPEYYLKNPGELTHSQLLDEFEKGTHSEFDSSNYSRTDEKVQYYNSVNANNTNNTVKEQNHPNSANKNELVDTNDNPGSAVHTIPTEITSNNADVIQEGFPVFGAEDGQYLAKSLGDPLIKGLTEVANVRPPEPIIYLANYLIDYSRLSNNENDSDHIIDENIWRQSPIQESKAAAIPKSRVSSARISPSHHRNIADNFNPINDNKFNHNSDDEYDYNDEENDDNMKSVNVINDNNNINNNNNDVSLPMNGFSGERRYSQNQILTTNSERESSFKSVQRDDHGQSTLHFAASRTHGRNGLFQLLVDMDCNIALRDELYRTARDIALQVNLPENVIAIDKYVVYLAANGHTDKLQELLLEGYDHILDATDDQQNIVEITAKRGHQTTLSFLQTISTFEERRDRLHRAIRAGNNTQVQEIIRYGNGPELAIAKNQHGRCSLHIAVLCQYELIVDHIATRYPQTLQVGDNLMRMPLHYAMGVDKVEILSRILIRAGAQRIVKDLKGRQPSYYFMNKSDIQQLQDEEDIMRQ